MFATAVFTSIAANYLPKARVLAESLKRTSPSTHFFLMLIDEPPSDFDLDQEPFDALITLHDLGIENVAGWCFGHRVVELCTAVKGAAACYLLETLETEKVFYFDPDMVIFDRFDELIQMLDDTSILLTPHQSEPEKTLDAVMDNEMASLKHGVFNLGFVGIKNDTEGQRFSRWWADRLQHFCRDDIQRGLFTDQKWANLIPCFFDRYNVLRSPAFNVATWNISTRKVSGSLEGGIFVNGEPLGFYHFSGFDSGDQELMLRKYAPDSQILFDMRRWYIAECEKNGQSQCGEIPYGYANFESGEAISQAHRDLYRVRVDLQRAFPNPFLQGADGGYLAWYEANASDGSTSNVPINIDDTTPTSTAILRFSDWMSRRATSHPSAIKRHALMAVSKLLSVIPKLS
jgi:hypothetical protein